MKIITGAVALILFSVASLWSQTTLYSIGQPTDEEQLYLEMINRARANPLVEGIMLATTKDADVLHAISQRAVNLTMMKAEFALLPVRPPLAFNSKLTQMARGHSQDMFDHAFQGHVGSNGSTLGQRAAAVSYPGSVGENVFSAVESVFYGHAGFQIDWGTGPGGMQVGRGHRVNIHENYREVGVGVVMGRNKIGDYAVGPQLVTQNFGTQNGSQAFVTGVAYYDLNGNGFYDLGEGIGGLTVNVNGSSYHAVTANSGGYTVPVPTAAAIRSVSFSGLGANGSGEAVIVGGANVKVDFKPVYVAPVVTGSGVAPAGSATNYSFTPVAGAAGYEWQALKKQPVANDGADNLSRVIRETTGSYTPLSSGVKYAGSASYHLAHPVAVSSAERLTYAGTFLVQDNAAVSFRSRLGVSTSDQIAKVEVSADNGLTWTALYNQPGTPSGEQSFSLRTLSLAAYAGRQIKLRFNYAFAKDTLYTGTGDAYGWFIDDVKWTGVLDTSGAVNSAVAPGQTSFAFVPPTPGDYVLSVRPLISGRAWAWGAVLPVVAPTALVDITVGIPENPEMASGATASFGNVAVGESSSKTFTLLSAGTQSLTNLSVSVTGGAPGEFTATALPATTLASGQLMQFTVTFTPTDSGNRSASLSILSNDPDESPLIVALNGIGSRALQLIGQPRSLAVKLGQLAAFDVEATPTSGLGYQWQKNNANINVTSKRYEITQAQMAHAGTYRVAVTGGVPLTTQWSSAVNLAVVEDVPKSLALQAGKSVTLTANATGPDLRYEWKRGGVLMGQGKTLALSNLTAGHSGTYVCEVRTGDSEPAIGGTTTLQVFSSAPAVLATQNMPDGMVGAAYYHKVKVDAGVGVTPTAFAAKNLPAGLKIDAKTGVISGRPTLAQSVTVILTASTPVGAFQLTDDVVIASYPANLAGTYVGAIGRAVMNQQLGGRLDLVVTSLGAYSGSLTQGTVKMAVKGQLDIKADGSELPSGAVTVQPPGKPASAAMVVTFTINPATHRFQDAQVTQGVETALIEGWRQIWSVVGKPATAYLKLHTFGLRLIDPGQIGNIAIPHGWGYGSFTPTLDGKVNVTGKTSDGEKFTMATFLGPAGEIFIYQSLYTTAVKGSLLGGLVLLKGNESDADDNILTGALTWTRPANTAATARIYKAGFGLAGTPVTSPVLLDVVGGRCVIPLASQLILGAISASQNARAVFEYGSIHATSDDPNVLLDITAGGKVGVSVPNPAALKLTVNPATGVIGGSFTLTDAPSPGAKDVKRTVTLQGLLIRDGAAQVGVGYFLLPELPSQGVPVHTRILSGAMTLRKN